MDKFKETLQALQKIALSLEVPCDFSKLDNKTVEEYAESVVESSDAFSQRDTFRNIRLSGVNLRKLETAADKEDRVDEVFAHLETLFIRACQLKWGKKKTRGFTVAVVNGTVPERFRNIKSEWLDEEHEIYAHCFRSCSSKGTQKEIASGKSLLKNVTQNAGINPDNIAPILEDEVVCSLAGRFAQFLQSSNTMSLVSVAVENVQRIVDSGQIDKAKLAREFMKSMQGKASDNPETEEEQKYMAEFEKLISAQIPK